MAVLLQFGVLAGSAQTNIYGYTGSETNVTLPPGTYIITAFGAAGGGVNPANAYGGLGAEMSAEFNFSTPTTLTLLVGSVGGVYYDDGGSDAGGGGGSFVVEGSTPLVVAGGGGGAVANLLGLSGAVAGGNGGAGGDTTSFGGFGGSRSGLGAGGGSGFYSDGGGGSGGGGFCFEAGATGGFSDDGYDSASGGFGGGGGGSSGGSYGFPNENFGGGGGGYSGGGGGGEEFHNGECDAGGGGGSIIDSSAIAILAEVAGTTTPNGTGVRFRSYIGEIIIIAVPTPLVITTGAAFGFTNGVFGFNVIGPSGSNVVIQASTDLQTWIPLQTNLLGSGPLYFSDPQSTTNVQRFYRAQLSP
jgi:hypothetical protein